MRRRRRRGCRLRQSPRAGGCDCEYRWRTTYIRALNPEKPPPRGGDMPDPMPSYLPLPSTTTAVSLPHELQGSRDRQDRSVSVRAWPGTREACCRAARRPFPRYLQTTDRAGA